MYYFYGNIGQFETTNNFRCGHQYPGGANLRNPSDLLRLERRSMRCNFSCAKNSSAEIRNLFDEANVSPFPPKKKKKKKKSYEYINSEPVSI